MKKRIRIEKLLAAGETPTQIISRGYNSAYVYILNKKFKDSKNERKETAKTEIPFTREIYDVTISGPGIPNDGIHFSVNAKQALIMIANSDA